MTASDVAHKAVLNLGGTLKPSAKATQGAHQRRHALGPLQRKSRSRTRRVGFVHAHFLSRPNELLGILDVNDQGYVVANFAPFLKGADPRLTQPAGRVNETIVNVVRPLVLSVQIVRALELRAMRLSRGRMVGAFQTQ
jgi:hypothetical protein